MSTVTDLQPGVAGSDAERARAGSGTGASGGNCRDRPALATMRGIVRHFGSSVAVDGVDLTLRGGEIHALALVQQHFTLVPTLTPSANLILARPGGRLLPVRSAAGGRLAALIDRHGLAVRDDVPAGQLSVGEQQRLELLTHRLGEVFAGCERVSVLREGHQVVDDAPVGVHTRGTLASAMIGAGNTGRLPARKTRPQFGSRAEIRMANRLSVEHLSFGRLDRVSIDVGAGQIVGIAGVDGNGQADLEAVVSGRAAAAAGRVSVEGAAVPTGDPRARRAMGLAYVPSDRYRWGLVRSMDLADNLELGRVPRWRPARNRRRAAAGPALKEWDVRASGPAQPAGTLSGGNAQKLVLARELDGQPVAVLACYPTRGLPTMTPSSRCSRRAATRPIRRATLQPHRGST